MQPSIFSIAFSVFLVALLPACATTPEVVTSGSDYRSLEAYLDWYIPRQLQRYDVPGISVALVDGDRLVLAKGYGLADVEREIPANEHTVYQAGSIAKVLTATAAMGLVERNRADLDLPITRYLPNFTINSRWENPAPITLRALLSHHAGLPTFYLKGFFSNQPLTGLLDDLRQEQLTYPPESEFSYSNIGTDLAGLTIERISGRPFAEYMRLDIFQPLAMTASGFEVDKTVSSRLAKGYIKGRPVAPIPVRDTPASGLYTNALDMSRFMRFVLTGSNPSGAPPLASATLRAMMAPQYPDNPFHFDQEFGLGWFLGGLPVAGAGKAVWHNGGTQAYQGQLVLLPDKQFGVVVLANADSAKTMVYDLAEEILRRALQVRDGIIPKSNPDPKPANAIKVEREKLQGYAGDYSLMGTLARVVLEGERLKLSVLGHDLDLVPFAPDQFRVEKSILGLFSIAIPFPPLKFTKVGEREFIVLVDRVVSLAEKVPRYTVPPAWRARLGSYRIINPDENYLVNMEYCRLVEEDGMLLLDMRISGIDDRRVRIVVMPYADDKAYVFGFGRNVGDTTVAYRDGDRHLIRYSGFVFERISDESAPGMIAAR